MSRLAFTIHASSALPAFMALVVLAIPGCGPKTHSGSSDERTAVGVAPLWSEFPGRIWDTNTISLCFQPFDQNSIQDPAWSAFTSHIRTVIEDAYEQPAKIGLQLEGWGLCPDWDEYEVGNQPTSTLEILVWMDGGNDYAATRYCDADHPIAFPLNCSGTGPHVVMAISFNYWALDTGILHEFAHALGFQHEYQRDDWDGVCQKSDSGTKANGVKITAYDKQSILSGTYCHTATVLSELDELGLEIVYPQSSVHDLAATLAYTMGDGTIVSRSNSIIMDEWLHRGAHEEAITAGQWTVDNDAIGTAHTIDASELALDTSSYVVKAFEDFLDREHTAEGSVIRSDSLHTAITMAALQR